MRRCTSCGCSPMRRLVEDVRHRGEARPEVAHELHALRLAARQRRARPVEAEVAEADVVEVPEPPAEGRDDRRDGRLVDLRDERGELAHLHRRALRDAHPAHARRARRLVEPAPLAGGARALRRDPLDRGADVLLEAVELLVEVQALELRDEALVLEVQRLRAVADLDLLALGLVEQLVALLGRVVADLHVDVEVARTPRRSPSTRSRPGSSGSRSRPRRATCRGRASASSSTAAMRPRPSHSGHIPVASLNE